MHVRVSVRTLGLLLFAVALCFLAGVYFGPTLRFLFYFSVLFPLALALSVVVPFRSLRVSQAWEGARLARGEELELAIGVENRSVLPLYHVAAHPAGELDSAGAGALEAGAPHERAPREGAAQERAEAAHAPGASDGTARPFELNLRSGERRTVATRRRFPHRGAFPVGIRRIAASDALGLLRVEHELETEPVTVYPHLYEIAAFSSAVDELAASMGSAGGRGAEDPGLFVQLREYREGESVRHIAWRKYAATGRPYLREYERQQRSGAALYLDTRPGEGSDPRELEDVSIEVFLSIMKHLVDRRIPLFVRAAGNAELERSATPLGFERVVHASVSARFETRRPLDEVVAHDSRAGLLDRKITIIVTHRADSSIRRIVEGGAAPDLHVALVTAGEPDAAARARSDAAREMIGDGGRLYVVPQASEIARVLERGAYEPAAGS